MNWFVTALRAIIILPICLAVILLALANDQPTTIHLNPFNPEDPVLSYELQFWMFAFLFFVLGVLFGGLITWLNQRRQRRRAYEQGRETARWQARERAPEAPAPPGVPMLARPERS